MLDGFGGEPLAAGHDRDEFGDHSLGQRHIGGLAGERQRVAAHMDIGRQDALECAQVLVGGSKQAHDEVGRNIDAAANGRVRVSVRLAGRHVGLSACFLGLAWLFAWVWPVYRWASMQPNS